MKDRTCIDAIMECLTEANPLGVYLKPRIAKANQEFRRRKITPEIEEWIRRCAGHPIAWIQQSIVDQWQVHISDGTIYRIWKSRPRRKSV